jgi:hypothetical protein
MSAYHQEPQVGGPPVGFPLRTTSWQTVIIHCIYHDRQIREPLPDIRHEPQSTGW